MSEELHPGGEVHVLCPVLSHLHICCSNTKATRFGPVNILDINNMALLGLSLIVEVSAMQCLICLGIPQTL